MARELRKSHRLTFQAFSILLFHVRVSFESLLIDDDSVHMLALRVHLLSFRHDGWRCDFVMAVGKRCSRLAVSKAPLQKSRSDLRTPKG